MRGKHAYAASRRRDSAVAAAVEAAERDRMDRSAEADAIDRAESEMFALAATVAQALAEAGPPPLADEIQAARSERQRLAVLRDGIRLELRAVARQVHRYVDRALDDQWKRKGSGGDVSIGMLALAATQAILSGYDSVEEVQKRDRDTWFRIRATNHRVSDDGGQP